MRNEFTHCSLLVQLALSSPGNSRASMKVADGRGCGMVRHGMIFFMIHASYDRCVEEVNGGP